MRGHSARIAFACTAAFSVVGFGASAAFGVSSGNGQSVKIWQTVAPLAKSLSLVSTNSHGEGTLQIVRTVGVKEVAVGAPLASFQWNTSTGPHAAAGPGVVWLYEAGIGNNSGAAVWRISVSTGAILQKTPVPFLTQSLIAADKNGVYLAASPASGSGGIAQGLIFRIGVGAVAATTVLTDTQKHPQDEFAVSMSLAGGFIHASVCTRPLQETPCHSVQVAERS